MRTASGLGVWDTPLMLEANEPRDGVTNALVGGSSADAVAFARTSAELGYGSFWTPEVTGAEAFSTLTAVGSAIEDVALGTGVVPMQTRSPVLAAMGGVSLQSLWPERRIVLGVGVSSPMVVSRWHGLVDDAAPIDRAREYLTVLRQALSGAPVSHDGEVYRLKKARLSGVGAERTPAVALGAMNPQMLGLAGELADMAILNYVSADAVPDLIDMVRAGEEQAGRPTGSCAVSCFVHVGVGDAEAARSANRRDLFGYSMAPGYRRSFRRHGFGDEMDRLEAALAASDRDDSVAAISDTMIDAINPVGTAAEVTAAVDAYRAAGLDEVIVTPLPWAQADPLQAVADTLAACAPTAQVNS